jgi:hypothetical protein
MDSQCAGMEGHAMMMKDENAKDAKDCTIKCVQDGGKYVLYDAKAKSTRLTIKPRQRNLPVRT